jgi:hypothetical protein
MEIVGRWKQRENSIASAQRIHSRSNRDQVLRCGAVVLARVDLAPENGNDMSTRSQAELGPGKGLQAATGE